MDVDVFDRLRPRRHDDDRNPARESLSDKILQHDRAVDIRQSDVEHDQIRGIVVDTLERLIPVSRLCCIEAGKRQRDLEHRPEVRIVFHDEDPLSQSHRQRILEIFPYLSRPLCSRLLSFWIRIHSILAKTQRSAAAAHGNQSRRDAEIRKRLSEVEELARANRRELDLQFRRIAAMQVEIDALKKPRTHD
jgi:hypothetical protein